MKIQILKQSKFLCLLGATLSCCLVAATQTSAKNSTAPTAQHRAKLKTGQGHFYGPLSKIKINASAIGKGWKAGLANQTADEIAATIGIGGDSAGTFDFSGKGMDTISINVFIFNSKADRESWQKEKCKFPGWKQQLREVRGLNYTVFETLPDLLPGQMQRYVGFENVGMVVWSMFEGKSDHYLKAERLFVQKIRSLERPLKTRSKRP